MGANTAGNIFGTANLDDEDEDDRPHPGAVAEVERAFSEAASWYKRRGFPAPNLLPIVETEQGPAYRIYLCKYREGGYACGRNPATGHTSAGLYVPLCGGDTTRTRFIYLNWEKLIGNTLGLNELGYQTVAHELMHAIMDNTTYGTPSACGSTAKWITEAIPDAISFDLADEIWANPPRYVPDPNSEQIIKRYGYRPYSESLPQRGQVPIPTGGDVSATYTTSSFWRYLADSHPDGWGVLISKKPGAAPGLLDIAMTGEPGWRREVTWLGKGLRSKFNRGLKDMYGLFVNKFAYRVAPMQSYAGQPAEDNLEHWTTLLFNRCTSVDLSSASKQVVTLPLMAIGSRCLWVEPMGTQGPVQVTFSAQSNDRALLQDVSVGMAGTTLLQRSVVAPNPAAPGSYVAAWRDFTQDGAERNLYLVSNTAHKPADSLRRTVTLEVARAGYSHSAWAGPVQPAGVAAKPLQPSYKKHSKKLSQQQRDTASMINEQMTLDKQSLTSNASRSAAIARRPNTPECTEPFKYAPCGPQLRINLALFPGTFGAPGGANAQGGLGAQMMGGLQAMSQTSMFGVEGTMQDLEARADAIDGSTVGIAIPLIDYGFSGAIDNAAISVKMSGGRRLHAIGPPDADGNTPLTGKVTIEEYTPLFIGGKFRAPLAELEANGDRPPIYHRRETVTGTFSSVVPWQSDERVQILQDSPDQIADDIANSLGVSAEMVHSMKQQGTFMPGNTPGAAPTATGGSGGSLQTGECTCQCEQRQFADDLCELFCEEEFAACDTP